MTFTVMIDRDLRQAACISPNQFETLILTPASTHSTQPTHSKSQSTVVSMSAIYPSARAMSVLFDLAADQPT